MRAEIMTITPEIAADFLSNNQDNRAIRPTKVKQLVSDMKSGRWQMNGESIIIAEDGSLNDGQHRLTAVLQSGVTIQSIVVFDVARETRTTVDVGANRTAGDHLGVTGVKHANVCASVANMFLAYNRRKSGYGDSASITKAEIFQWVNDNKSEVETIAYEYSGKHDKSAKYYAPPSVFSFCALLILRDDTEMGRKYMQQVITGENIRAGDPAFAVRNALLRSGKTGRSAKSEMILRGWVRFKMNQPLTLVKVLGEYPIL